MKKFIIAISSFSLLATIARSDEAADLKPAIERGKAIYMQTCVACHQPTLLAPCGQ